MKLTWLGHACFLLEQNGYRLIVDPYTGVEGYPELRERLRGLVSQRLTSEQRFAITSGIEQGDVLATVLKNDAHNIRKTVEALSQEDFDNVVRRLLDARRIYVMGLRSAPPRRNALIYGSNGHAVDRIGPGVEPADQLSERGLPPRGRPAAL